MFAKVNMRYFFNFRKSFPLKGVIMKMFVNNYTNLINYIWPNLIIWW